MSILADQGASCPPYHFCMQDMLQTVGSPSHIIAELIFSLVFDGLVIYLAWGRIIKPYLARRDARIHQEIDTEHNVMHVVVPKESRVRKPPAKTRT